jgi:hypothetical protein
LYAKKTRPKRNFVTQPHLHKPGMNWSVGSILECQYMIRWYSGCAYSGGNTMLFFWK